MSKASAQIASLDLLFSKLLNSKDHEIISNFINLKNKISDAKMTADDFVILHKSIDTKRRHILLETMLNDEKEQHAETKRKLEALEDIQWANSINDNTDVLQIITDAVNADRRYRDINNNRKISELQSKLDTISGILRE